MPELEIWDKHKQLLAFLPVGGSNVVLISSSGRVNTKIGVLILKDLQDGLRKKGEKLKLSKANKGLSFEVLGRRVLVFDRYGGCFGNFDRWKFRKFLDNSVDFLSKQPPQDIV